MIEGKLTAFEIAPLQQVVRHLLGDLQRDVLLRLGGGGAEMRRAHDIGMAEQRVVRSPAPRRTRRRRRPRPGRSRARARSAASSTRPPRAQLMMRTPFFIVAIAAASMMFLVLSVSGVCSVMKSARLNSSSSSTFSHAEVARALGRQERIVGDHLHAQADARGRPRSSRYCRSR